MTKFTGILGASREVVENRWPACSPVAATEKLLGDRLRFGSIRVHQPDTGPAVQDVVDRQRAFVRDGVFEFGPGDVDALGHRLGRPLAARVRDDVRRLCAVAGDQ